MTAPSSPPPTFAINERVLCYHGPLIYEAKILKSDNFTAATTTTEATGPHYFVHYKGWKQTWDEWVPAQRLLKHTESNLAIQKTLHQDAQKTASAAAAAAAPSASAAGPGAPGRKAAVGGRGRKDGARGTKRGREDDEANRRPDMKLNVPEVLKVQLVDDWEAVTKENRLVSLIRTPTVVEILHEFQAYVTEDPGTNFPHLRDPALLAPSITAGLQTYFDRALGANLLYRPERPQYAGIRKQYISGQHVVIGQEKEMSEVYGAEHLLRMLVSLPQMIQSSAMDAESIGLIRDYVNELLSFMVKNKERFFQSEYETSSIGYQNIARS